MNTDIYTYVHTYHGRVDVGEVLIVLILLAVKSGGNKGEGRRRTVSSHEEREIGRSIDSAIFIINFTLLGGSINRIPSAQDEEDRSLAFFLPSVTLTSFHSYDGRERKDHHHARTRRARRLGFFAAEDTHQSSPTTSGSADGQARFFFFYALSSIWLHRNFNFIFHLGGFQQGHSSVTSLSSWLLDVSWQKGRQISQWCDFHNVR